MQLKLSDTRLYCSACGDAAEKLLFGRPLCKECYLELGLGRITPQFIKATMGGSAVPRIGEDDEHPQHEEWRG